MNDTGSHKLAVGFCMGKMNNHMGCKNCSSAYYVLVSHDHGTPYG